MLGTRYTLWKLHRERRRLERENKRVWEEAQKKDDEAIYSGWRAEHGWELDLNDASINTLKSLDLVRRAEKLYLPTPERGGKDWLAQEDLPGAASIMGSYSVLTPQAMNELRAAVRKASRENIEWWVKVVGGAIGILTGLVGALIGLIAIWKK